MQNLELGHLSRIIDVVHFSRQGLIWPTHPSVATTGEPSTDSSVARSSVSTEVSVMTWAINLFSLAFFLNAGVNSTSSETKTRISLPLLLPHLPESQLPSFWSYTSTFSASSRSEAEADVANRTL